MHGGPAYSDPRVLKLPVSEEHNNCNRFLQVHVMICRTWIGNMSWIGECAHGWSNYRGFHAAIYVSACHFLTRLHLHLLAKEKEIGRSR